MSPDEREIRAARNQAMFRAVNERIRQLNETLASVTDEFAIACECADATCVHVLNIRPVDYHAVRRNPRQFVVLPGHVYDDVETVVAEADGWIVVQKTGGAADVVEMLASRE